MNNLRKKFIDKQHKQIAVNTCWFIMKTDAEPDLPQRLSSLSGNNRHQ